MLGLKARRFVGLAVALWFGVAGALADTPDIVMPELSAEAAAGQTAFAQHCAACHGEVGDGSDNGPPLIHRVYRPGHHADFAFLRALRYGSRAHHWRFGNMPPMPEVSDDEAAAIISFVRAVQRANGIE